MFVVAILIILCGVYNYRTITEARAREDANPSVIWSGDSSNHIQSLISRTSLDIKMFPTSKIRLFEDENTIPLDRAMFGAVPIFFSDLLFRDFNLSITFSEVVHVEHAWTRQDMNNDLNGYGISFVNSKNFASIVHEIDLQQ